MMEVATAASVSATPMEVAEDSENVNPQTVDNDKSDIDRLLDELQKVSSELSSQSKIDASKSDTATLKKLKEQFRSLKVAYKQLQLTEGFLERISKADPLQDLEDEIEVANSEILMKESKENLKNLRSDTKKLQADLQEKSRKKITLESAFREKLAQLQERAEQLRAAKLKLSETKENLGPMPENLSTAEDYHAYAEKQAANIQNLNDRKQVLQDQLYQAQQHIEKKQKELEEARRSQPVSTQAEEVAALEQKVAKAEEMKDWYTTMNEFISTVSGMSVCETAQNELQVRYNETGHDLIIRFKEESVLADDAKLRPADITIEDLRKQLLLNNDLVTFVREVRNRLFNRKSVKGELENLAEGYDLRLTPENKLFINLTEWIQAVINVPFDYPELLNFPKVEALTAVDDDSHSFGEIKNRVNAMEAARIDTLVRHLHKEVMAL